VSEGLGTIFPILIISLLMGFGIYLFDIALLHTIENQIIRLILMVAIGIVLYYILLKLKYKKLKQMIKI
jgi:high-affinity Fe2+/Pb2+ permease